MARNTKSGPVAAVGMMHLQATGSREVQMEAVGKSCQCKYTAGAASSDRPILDWQAACMSDYRLLGKAGMMKQAAGAAVDTVAGAGY